jgi:hypothetical protein
MLLAQRSDRELDQQFHHRRLQIARPTAFLRLGNDMRLQHSSGGGNVPSGNVLEPPRVGHHRVARGQRIELDRSFCLSPVGQEEGCRAQGQ